MGLEHSTRPDTDSSRAVGPASLARDRFLRELRAGQGPLIEDYLEGQVPSGRAGLLRELIAAEREWRRGRGLDVDPSAYRARFPSDSTLVDAICGEPGSTVTLLRLDPAEAEAGLLVGFLCLANGLLSPGALIAGLNAWSGEPGRPILEFLVGRGHLGEADASMVAALASSHLGRHGGIAREGLAALGEAVRFRLDPAEVGDPELRALLGGFIAATSRPRGPSRADGASAFGPRYEILRDHARGGLGVVSVAHDKEIHREVAVKEIREDRADHPDYRARFLREAEVTGRLEHPGIVPVYGMGLREDGRPYYIMRFIRGETLKVAIHRLHKVEEAGDEVGASERPDLHSLVGRFVDACHAVAYAHHRKILHRDLKPINIMLGPFGETLVVDWGLAKAFDGPRSGESPIEEGTLRVESGSGMTPTSYGLEVGTPGYMSPEQAAGRLEELGPPSDIYSLGVTLHYLATGHGPFEGVSKEEFLRRVREGNFPAPREVAPTVPRALEAICLKAMALRPIDRYQSAVDLAEDLERWRAGQPVLAYPEPPLDRLARWSRRHKTALAGAAVLLACSTIGLAIFAGQQRRANRTLADARALADARRDEANRERNVADQQRAASEASRKLALGLLKSTLREVAGADLTFLARSEALRDRMAGELVESYRDLLRGDPADKKVRFDLAQACQLSANVGRSIGKPDRPRELYAEAIGLLESLGNWSPEGEDTRLELATLHDDAGENFRVIGKPKEARAEFLYGLETLRRYDGSTRPAIVRRRAEARLQLDLSGALGDLGRLDLAKEAGQRAIDLLKPLASETTADRSDRLLLGYALLGRASILRLGGEFDRAKDELADAERRARELVAAVSDPDTRFALAAVRNEQGLRLIDASTAGQRSSALKAFEDALFYNWPLYNDMPRMIEFQRSLCVTLIGRGACYLEAKRLKEAREDFSNARTLLEELNSTIPGHFDLLGQLGQACAGLSRTSLAEGKADAGDLMLKAITHHSAALKANPDSPVDGKFLAQARRELFGLGDGAASPPPRTPSP